MVKHVQDKHVDAFTDKVGGHLNSVVGLLLRHNKAEIRTLGARLLAQFEKVQVGACNLATFPHTAMSLCIDVCSATSQICTHSFTHAEAS